MAASSELIMYSSMLLKSLFRDLHQSDHLQNQNQNQTYKFHEFLYRVEEERRKIDAFKHELPLCVQLLTHAMEASRKELEALGVKQGTRPAREAPIFIEHSSENNNKAPNEFYKMKPASEGAKEQSSYSQDSSLRDLSDDEPALASAEKKMDDKKYEETAGRKREYLSGNDGKGTNPVASPAQTGLATTTTTTTQTHKIARHTWSPNMRSWRSQDEPRWPHFPWRPKSISYG